MILQVRPEDRNRFDDFVDRFRARWQTDFSHPLTLNHFDACLPTDDLRRPVLVEAVAIDLVSRLNRGEKVRLKDYLKLIEELGSIDELPLELLYAEYTSRKRFDATFSEEEFLESYPSRQSELKALIESKAKAAAAEVTGTLSIDHDRTKEHIEPIPAPLATDSLKPDSVTSNSATSDLETAESSDEPASTIIESFNSRSTERFISLEGGYRMIRRIGKGNFGEVWLSEAPGGVEVALKVVHIPAGQRVRDLEIRSLDLMKRLRHPFLLQVQAFWVSDEHIHIAMELADESLRDCMHESENKVIPLEELLRHMREAAEGIDYLHRQKVVHRDIKPENLLMLKRHIKVADFGLARFMDESGLNATATQVAGSPLYMAPEVWHGKPEASSDQYSLAVTYAELRVGRAPFSSTNMVEVMKEHLYAEPNLSSFEPAEKAVLKTALSKHPGDRFASCSEFVQALATATAKPVTGMGQRPAALSRRAWMSVIGSVSLVLIVLAALAYQYWPSGLRSRSDGPEVTLRENVALAYGEQMSVEVSGTDKTDTAESIVFDNVPEQLSVDFVAERSAIDIAADLNAPLGDHKIGLTISTPRGETTKALEVAVVDSERLRIPARARPVPSDAARIDHDGRIFYQKVLLPLPSDDQVSVEFTLIPRDTTSDPPTFYMMTREVTNREFSEFAAARADKISADSLWKQGALAGADYLGVDGMAADLPVVHVTAEEAHAFAEWIGGVLPSTAQWDKAAGANEKGRGLGPFQVGNSICIDRFDLGPVAAGSSEHDVSGLGVRDMAGSVAEFTRNILGSSLVVPLTDSIATDRVILRGQSYHDPEPWKFEQTTDSIPPSLPYHSAKPEIGFRVVLELL